MSRAWPVVFVLVVLLSACTQGGGAASAVASTAASTAASVAASGPCIDRGALGDDAVTVHTALLAVAAALKTGDGDKARASATGAAAGMRTLATLVEPARPDAATAFRAAADKLDAAAPAFPEGTTTVADIQSAFDAAYDLARTVACPE